MSSEGSGTGVVTRQPTHLISIVTPHVLRFRRPILRQPAEESDAGSVSSGCSRSQSPPVPCLPAAGRARIISLHGLAAATSAASPSVASPSVASPSVASPSVASPASVGTAPSMSTDSDGGEVSGASQTTASAQTSWCTASLSPLSACRPDGMDADTAHISMGCDVVEMVPADLDVIEVVPADLNVMEMVPAHLHPRQEAALLRYGGAAEPTADFSRQATQTPALGDGSAHMSTGEPALSDPVAPLMGSQLLSSADIPLQDEYVIEDFDDEPDGETMAEELFRCARHTVVDGDDLWSGGATRLADDCGEVATPRWDSEPSPQMMNSDPVLLFDGSYGDYRRNASGCRCSLASSYNKQLLLDQHVDVQILPADPLSPPEERGVPESKASVAIKRLISSVVPPISAELVQPQLFLDSDSLGAWPSPNMAAAAYTPQTKSAGSAPKSPRLEDVNATMFLPSVGPPTVTPDARLLPDGPAVILTPEDVVEIEVPSSPARRGRGGSVRGRRARGGARRNAKTPTTGGGKRASRGRGRRARGRGRGRVRSASSVREVGDELIVSADEQQEDAWLAQAACRDGAGDDSDSEPAALRRQPCQHFRKVVVGLSDLGPEPLAPTSKYQLWRRLSGTPEMMDLCHCLDLSYLILETPNGDVRYRCNICSKEFALQSSVRRHHRMVHDDERRYSCAECAASYFQLSDLKRHLLASHTDLKPFMCTLCGERFARDTDYRKHIVNRKC